MMLSIDEFNQELNKDFQRNNMFTVVFATTPSSKTQQLLSDFGGFLYDNIPFAENFKGLSQGMLTNTVTSIISQGTQNIVRRSGMSKFLIGAMSNRMVQSMLGEFEVGTYVMDFFNMGNTSTGLLVYSVKIPANQLNYEMDKLHAAPGIRITSREYEPLVLSFRMDSESKNFRAMQDWINAVEDPITGLRALPSDVEADIQVNLHNRRGIPHTVAMFSGCIPVNVSAPELSYDNNNEVSTFDVTFAYRSMQIGAVGANAIKDWLEGDFLSTIGKGAGQFINNLGKDIF